jgi:antitoxin YefM
LATLRNRAFGDREVVIMKRRDHAIVATIAADDRISLMETAHLLRSPANAERLLSALARARRDESKPRPRSKPS